MTVVQRIEYFAKRGLKVPVFKFFCFIGTLLSPFTNRNLQKDKIGRILVFQDGGLGDVIRIFPLLKPLRMEFPQASISVLSPFDRGFFDLYTHVHIISEFIVMNVSGKYKSVLSKLSLVWSLRKKSFDLIICPQVGLGMIEFSFMSFLMGAPYRIGYDMYGSGLLYTTKVPLLENESIYYQHINLLRHSGILSGSGEDVLQDPSVTVIESADSFARHFYRHNNIADNDMVFCISPVVMADRGNKSPQHDRPLSESRSWPEENYVELINRIHTSLHAKILILGDRIGKGPLLTFLEKSDNPDIISAIGRTSVGESAALIRKSNMFISNDSGMLHIAVALRVQSIGIFSSTSPRQVMPDSDKCIYIWKNVDCSPCFIHQPVPDFTCSHNMKCLTSITVDDVMASIQTFPD